MGEISSQMGNLISLKGLGRGMDYLEKIHERSYEILKHIDEICQKNNIPYFLMGGSLLGAVRHKGFIPWDDDIDLGMVREDYERFIQIWKDTTNYSLIEFRKNKDYANVYSKISDNNSKLYPWYYRENFDYKQGAFVDIFPMDYAPENYQEALKVQKKVRFLRSVLHNNKISKLTLPSVGVTFKQKCFLLTGKLFAYLLNRLQSHEKLVEKIQTLLIHQKSDSIVNFATQYELKREIFPVESTKNIIRYTFENGTFPIFEDYDTILRIQYGDDYMVIPKNIDPTAHHAFWYVEIDGKVYIENGEVINL